MVAFYNINEITLGPSSHSSGHEAYLNARHKSSNKKIIFKKNKYGIAAFSRMEASFSHLAKLFLSPDLTPAQKLVEDNKHKVIGLAVEHLCYSIHHKEGLSKPFYSLTNPGKGVRVKAKHIKDLTKIPIYFLDNLPQAYFAQLLEAEKKAQLTIDYDSLASILATSYTMEEDDLHKGNFGFYLVQKDGKPHAVFFKIDHDLMFVDSIMGFYTRRPFHFFHGPSAFDIIAQDLISFPNLQYSANSYWPTKFGYVANPFDNKEYHSFKENAAFASLEHKPEFIKAKWKTFYKHILIPTELIKKALCDCADSENNLGRAHNALLTQAMVARLAALRAVLFSIKEFREFVVGLSEREKDSILREIVPLDHPLKRQIMDSFTRYNELCTTPNGFEEGDTPLHTAIKLNEYRYDDTTRMFGQFINSTNKAGKTPLDIACERTDRVNYPVAGEDIRKDTRLIMQHLLDKGARKTTYFKSANIDEEIKNHKYTNPYLSRINPTVFYANFKSILRDIGEDHRFCLKYKKNLAIECIKEWIKIRKDSPYLRQELKQLQTEVNGTSSEMECAPLKYIRQLRSKLWIVRQLRGLYGQSSSQTAINAIIDEALESYKSQKYNHFAFFPLFNFPDGDLDDEGYQPIPNN